MEIWILQGCSHHTPWLQPLTYGIIWVKKPIYEFDKTGRKFLWRWIIIRDPLIFPLMSIFITGRSPFFLLHYQGRLTFLDAIKSFLSWFLAMFIVSIITLHRFTILSQLMLTLQTSALIPLDPIVSECQFMSIIGLRAEQSSNTNLEVDKVVT